MSVLWNNRNEGKTLFWMTGSSTKQNRLTFYPLYPRCRPQLLAPSAVSTCASHAGDGRGIERGGNDDSGPREGKLVDVRRRYRKRGNEKQLG